MGIDLVLQHHQIAFPLGFVFLHNILHELFQIPLHFFDSIGQILYFIHTGSLYLRIQIPCLYSFYSAFQSMHGLCDFSGNIEVNEHHGIEEKRQQKQDETSCFPVVQRRCIPFGYPHHMPSRIANGLMQESIGFCLHIPLQRGHKQR